MAKLITNAKQLASSPIKLRNKIVEMPWEHANGDTTVELCVWELLRGEFKAMAKDAADSNIDWETHFLAATVRDKADPHGNRIWHEAKDAEAFLDSKPWQDTQVLLDAANEVNGRRKSSAEGNSQTTGSDDSPSNSA